MEYHELFTVGQQLVLSFAQLKNTNKAMIVECLRQLEAINEKLCKYGGGGAYNIIRFDPDEADFKKLPKELTLYRGYREHEKREGISWSLSKSLAESFAVTAAVKQVAPGAEHLAGDGKLIGVWDGTEYFGTHYTESQIIALPCTLITGTCALDDVLAYTNARKEQEIIINPEKVKNIKELSPMSKERITEIRTKGYKATAEPIDWLLKTKQHQS